MPSPPPVDLARPILGQVARLGDAYDAWVHRSIKPKQGIRIFRRDVLEALTHTPWWLVPVVWGPIFLGLFVAALRLGLGGSTVLALVVLGLFLWTFLEYALHRCVFHYRPQSAFGRRVHFLAHGIHHLDPWDRTRLVFPPLLALAIALPVFGLIWAVCLIFQAVLPFATAVATMAGLILGYVVYDLTHYAMHHKRATTRWGKFLKAYHLTHHHKHPDRMFGVSQPLWDLVFGSGRPEPATGDCRAREGAARASPDATP